MKEQEFVSLFDSNNFDIPNKIDDSLLIKDNKYFKGWSLYNKPYNGVNVYTLVLGNEGIIRSGFNAMYTIDGDWYIIPIVLNRDIFSRLLPIYRKSLFIKGFAPTSVDKDKMSKTAIDLSTPLRFSGELTVKANKPNKRFPASFNLQLNKNTPIVLDHESIHSQIDSLKDLWENE